LKPWKCLLSRHGSDDIGITRVRNAQRTNPEVLPASRAQVHIIPTVVVHARLGQHGVVLNLRLAERRTVVGDDDQLALAAPERLQGRGVAQRVLPGLHHQSESVVDRLLRLLRLLGGHHGEGIG